MNPAKAVGKLVETNFADRNSMSKRVVTPSKITGSNNFNHNYAPLHIKARKLTEFQKYLTKDVGKVADKNLA